MLHHCGVVVAGDGAGVVDAEGVEGVGERCSGFDGIERSLENDILSWDGVNMLPADGAEEGNVVC